MTFLLHCGAAALLALTQPNPPQNAGTAVPAPQTLRADDDDARHREASVIEVTQLRQGNIGAKLYGTAGGDPAMNGLYTYIAFYESPAEGHRVFQIGDFNEYRVHEEAPGRIVLEVDENYLDEGGGEIASRTRRITVSWTLGPDNAAPTSVRVVHAPIE